MEVVHLDLANGLPQQLAAREPASEPAGLYIVFWWQDIPLGHARVPRDQLPITAAGLAALAGEAVALAIEAYWMGRQAPPWGLPEEPRPADLRKLLCLRRPVGQLEVPPSGTLPQRVSVVICTRDRPADLRRCLDSLAACTPAPHEIVVVDNASQTAATRKTVESFPAVAYVAESRPGLDIARNTGLRRTTGEIVAFTDDDVTVRANWIVRTQQAFQDSRVMGLTGLVLPELLDTPARCLFEQEWGFHRGYRAITFDGDYFRKLKRWGVPAWTVGAGANMAFRRSVFQQIGDFDERLDVGAAGCSGDSEVWYRMLAAGLTCRYDPQVVVLHRHRETMAGLRRQMRAYMRGHTAALLVQFARHGHLGNLLRLFVLLPAYYTRRLFHRFLFGAHPRYSMIGAELAGCVSGVLFYLRCVTRDRRCWSPPQVLVAAGKDGPEAWPQAVSHVTQTRLLI